MPPHLKKPINQANLANGTYEQIVTHLQKELEVNGLEAPDELQIHTVCQQLTNTNADRPKLTCPQCKKPGHYRNQCPLLKNSENKLKIPKIIRETEAVKPITLTRPATSTITTTRITTATKTGAGPRENRKLFTRPVRHVEKQTTSQRKTISEPLQPINRLLV